MTTIHTYILTKNHRALRKQLHNDLDLNTFQLLGSFDEDHPFEVESPRCLTDEETRYLCTCPNVVGFLQKVETPCVKCGVVVEVLLNEQTGGPRHPGLCDKCHRQAFFNRAG